MLQVNYALNFSSFSRPSLLATQMLATASPTTFREVTAYTGGLGQMICTLDGYGPCHNEEEIIAAAGYDPDADLANPSGSVFCFHGAGVYGETAAHRKSGGCNIRSSDYR